MANLTATRAVKSRTITEPPLDPDLLRAAAIQGAGWARSGADVREKVLVHSPHWPERQRMHLVLRCTPRRGEGDPLKLKYTPPRQLLFDKPAAGLKPDGPVCVCGGSTLVMARPGGPCAVCQECGVERKLPRKSKSRPGREGGAA